ncbi:hypothetical protein PRIPAC_88959 [Pristionchus pacificus]|uniref:Uncharacterized protein n=1 Tax=Pristionchus pacificus TaxID=54126 RepID=A0A2A6CWW3_PRIPA|nr:hypothetical protein PRIPAC_88959 [Pristionchus pacificus]|eukprot:PDM82724.1 hypothetical protein PRIPAC_37117 [Pristionchus pacificus]
MLKYTLILVFAFTVSEGRVSFEKSEVLDDVDLRGTTTIVIVDSPGKEYETLQFLSQIPMGQNYPLESGNYQLKNKGLTNPSFVFYAVETGASNYGTPVAYVSATSQVTVSPSESSLVTVMSSSGVDAFPAVYATGFDAVTDKTCRPVYNAINAYYMYNVGFPINSPIATINFKNSSRHAYSPFTRYQLTGIRVARERCEMKIHPGIVAVIDGEFSIAKATDAATLVVNDESQELYGKDQKLCRTEEGWTISIGVKWASTETNAKDLFALQIDMIPADLLTAQSSTTRSVLATTTSSDRVLGGVGILLVIPVLLRIQ